ncbi:MAG: beta-lactamase family protein [Cytophagales bacterium]|nr:beta-lactamase family protein [Rhizobacter sp.]
MNAAALQKLDDVVTRDTAAGRLPGAVMLVYRDGKVVHEKVIGQRDPQAAAPMAADSIFRIYSMTKPIVSVGLMMLVEDGKVQLSDPISRHLPEFKDLKVGVEKKDAAGNAVLELTPSPRVPTVQDLLRHTSGLTYGVFGKSLVKSEYLKVDIHKNASNNTELSRKLASLPLANVPGSTWEYSRSTDLIGSLIERVSGQTLGVYLQQRILGPLGMKDSGFSVPAEKLARLAQPFKLDPDTKQPVTLIDVTKPPVFESGGGGMVSTAADYLRFARMVLNGGELDGVRLLSAKTVESMTSDHLGPDIIRASRVPGVNTGYLPGPGFGFGLGFAVRLAPGESASAGSVGEANWGGLGGTYFWIDSREKLIAIWMMQAPGQREYYRGVFKNMVYGAF